MAKVFSYNGGASYPAILEDPRPGNDGFYLFGDRHDKTSLTPQFNSRINFSTGGGYTAGYFDSYASETSNYYHRTHLMTNKMNVHVPPWQSTSSSYTYTNFDDTVFRYMDPVEQNQMGPMVASDENGQNSAYYIYGRDDYRTGIYQWSYLPADDVYLDEIRPSNSTLASDYYFHSIAHKDYAKDGYVHGLCQYHSSNSYFYPQYYTFAWGSGWPTSFTGFYTTSISGFSSYWGVQVLGRSTVDGEMMYVGSYSNGGSSSNQVKVQKATRDGDGYPTWTSLHESATSIAAAGTHQGGNNLNSRRIWHTCSSIFDDPRAAGKKCFYKTWFDQYGDYHPLLTTWTQADDTFVTETDISITGDKSTVHASLMSFSTEGTGTNVGCPIHTEQWYSNSTRYVGYFPLDSRQLFTSDTGWKTIIVYEVDSADPKALTYHSKLTLTDTPRNMIWLNDERTLLGLFFKNNFKMYVWNDVSGWTESAVIGQIVHAIGRDSLDRIWYTTKTSDSTESYPDINLLSPTLPVSVNITPENNSYAYGGSDITTYINVSALNASGARIATNVRLVIEGSSMTFTDGSTTKTVTTLTSGDLQVGTTVTGAGYTNITASIEL